ncbi:PIN domain-containing protein [Erwiniaceae bacterium L1_55_4]|nr:PIN domain-containing protein [Erwiniaceae bacterium L1_55_4]
MPNIYIIDTNVLFQYPQILSRTKNRKLVIPTAVMHEILYKSNNKKSSAIADLVASSIHAGMHIVDPPTTLKNELIHSDRNAQRLSGTDFDIARIAIHYAEKQGEETPCVVTDDKSLCYFLTSRNIKFMTGLEFINESKNDSINKEIEKKAEKFISSQTRYFLASLSIGIFTSISAKISYFNIELLVSTATVWGTMLGLPFLGLILFWYREKFRLSYGVFEFCIGVIMSYYVFFPTFDYSSLGVKEGIQILGGLYAMVRGMDNIGKGIIGTRLEPLWLKVF